jgi:23S rRNA pseudouridine2605 synthase
MVSLARALSKLGLCSRSEAMHAIRDGRVRVNGRRVTDASLRVTPERDRFTIDGVESAAPAKTYVLLNKPRGTVTTRSDPRGRPTVYDCFAGASLPFLAPVGRLDQASEGALLFTNDTQWANAITAPSSRVIKTYDVQIDRVPTDEMVDQLRAGILDPTLGLLTAADARILRSGERRGWLQIDLDEGRNRQIRRMLDALSIAVLRLIRVRIGPLALGALHHGEWRALTAAEVQALRRVAPRARRPPT